MATVGHKNLNTKLVLLGNMRAGRLSRFLLEIQESTMSAASFSQALAVNDTTKVKFEVLLGDMGACKSSLVLRFIKGQFLEVQESTIGAAFFSQTLAVNDTTVKFEIWDTAGRERYRAAAAIIVFDITNLDTFSRAKKFVPELKKQVITTAGSPNLARVLARNKADSEEKRSVPAEDVNKDGSIGGENTSENEGQSVNTTSAWGDDWFKEVTVYEVTEGEEVHVEVTELRQMIPVYEGEKDERSKKGEFNLLLCTGYYTFAYEVQQVHRFAENERMPIVHVCWPWAPKYGIAEYFGYERNEDKKLNPLTEEWKEFRAELDYVIVSKLKEDEEFITLSIINENQIVAKSFQLLKSVINNSDELFTALYLYYCSTFEVEPKVKKYRPSQPWNDEKLTYYDAKDNEIIPPYEQSSDVDDNLEDEAITSVSSVICGKEKESDDGDAVVDEFVSKLVRIEVLVEWMQPSTEEDNDDGSDGDDHDVDDEEWMQPSTEEDNDDGSDGDDHDVDDEDKDRSHDDEDGSDGDDHDVDDEDKDRSHDDEEEVVDNP